VVLRLVVTSAIALRVEAAIYGSRIVSVVTALSTLRLGETSKAETLRRIPTLQPSDTGPYGAPRCDADECFWGLVGNGLPARILLGTSPDVSPRGRVAGEKGLGPATEAAQNPEIIVPTLSSGLARRPRPVSSVFLSRRDTPIPATGPATHWSGTPSLSAAQSCTLQLPVHLAEQIQVRIARRQRYPDFPYRDTNLGPDLEQL
jgi:hypothetical protein